MDWPFKKTGIINRYVANTTIGTQPVRIVHHMLLHVFKNTHDEFMSEILQEIELGKLDRELLISLGEEPIRMGQGKMGTPKVNIETKKIEIHETFLSYLWCCTYSVYISYLEKIDFPAVNKSNGKIVHVISPENIKLAEQLFEYGKYLIVHFMPWDKHTLPNPEVYPAENRTYVTQTNMLYTEAMKFILCHEFTHIKLHVDQINETTQDSHYLNFEIEADNNAIELMKKGINSINQLAVENGIILAILSMFFFNAKTTGVKHPNFEDRLTNALERLDLNGNVHAWGIACMGLQMWDNMFGLNFKWTEEPISYQEEYYKIVAQIKEQKF